MARRTRVLGPDDQRRGIMTEELIKKVLRIAAQICRMHGEIAGHRICQDWSGETDLLDDLTSRERDHLSFWYQQHNSGGQDFEPGYFPYDEMLISFIIARTLDVMSDGPANP